MQMMVPKGRANYEPNSIDPGGPRESSALGLTTAAVATEGNKVRLRAASFRDHYSQARLFYRSVTAQERRHIAQALTFELSKVTIPEIRRKMLGHLDIVDKDLGIKVAEELGMSGEAETIQPAAMPVELDPSPALRLYGKYKPTLNGRKVGILLAPGFGVELKDRLVAAIKQEGATAVTIALNVGSVKDSAGGKHQADSALSGSPSVLFDAVAILSGPAGDAVLSENPDAIGFLMDACRHLKAIALCGVPALGEKAHSSGLAGITNLSGAADIGVFISLARNGRVWEREGA